MQPSGLEHENGVAVVFGRGPVGADIGGDVADSDVPHGEIMMRRPPCRVPALQHVLDRWIGADAEVRRVSLVHRGDLGRDGRPAAVAIIRRNAHAFWRFDQERGMPHEGEADRVLRQCDRGDERRSGCDQTRTALGASARAGEAAQQDESGSDREECSCRPPWRPPVPHPIRSGTPREDTSPSR